MEIKRAKLSDAASIAVLFNAYRRFYRQADDLQLAQGFISNRLRNEESVIFYAKSEDYKYVGFSQLFPAFSSVAAKRLWILNDLYVLDSHRGMGIGSLLLDRTRQYAQETNACGIALETERSNTGAQKLYAARGYEQESRSYHYFLATEC